jgi:5-methylcytosine-specific restriction endonuclease McrA
MAAGKTCNKCDEVKPSDAFVSFKESKDGLYPTCRACKSEYDREYSERPEVKARRQATRDAYNARPEVQERRRKYEAARLLIPEAKERKRAANREQKRKLRSTPEGRAKNAAIVKAWRERNPETSRDRIRLANQKRKASKLGNDSRRVSTAEAKRILGQPCVNCGSSKHIQIDHIIPLSRGGRHAIGNLQPLCSFCNLSKNNSLQIEWRYRQRRMVEVGRDR